MEISLGELEGRLAPEGIEARRDLEVRNVVVDELRMAHTRVQQVVHGVPVFGGEAIVHLERDGGVFAVTDAIARKVSGDLQVTPAFGPEVAIDIVLAGYDCVDCLTDEPTADLWVLPMEDAARLAYRVSLRREDGSAQTGMPVVFVDALGGETLWSYDNLQTNTVATGHSLYNGQVQINTYAASGQYTLEDTTRRIATRDNRNTPSALLAMFGFAGSTYDFASTGLVWGTLAGNAQNAGVEAHYASGKVYDFYKTAFGRNGIDGNNGPGTVNAKDGGSKLVVSRVHYSTKYNNAFWNGSVMTYGDGDGTTFSPLVTLDICGHEMTHGVIERTANLTYSGESGALNEAIADIMGAMVERSARGESANTWLIGEDAYTPGTPGDALRYMDDPHRAPNNGYTANGDPDHYSERYTGTADNGGVHINSGIVNKMFYLLAVGGEHHRGGSMAGIGADKAAAIVYKALTSYMTSSTNFAQARTAMINAATALHGSGSAEATAVGQAWSLVGVN
ncbi:M4 family metallopeptidase [Chondromyces crocatus]|uniref:M4 family metallopeptidase n=1 Tax=Chondromyces crocatus TaxID=52 RepID=UPI00146FF549|nr:M4 family metallopeptidase [Chondromyces crocatus]